MSISLMEERLNKLAIQSMLTRSNSVLAAYRIGIKVSPEKSGFVDLLRQFFNDALEGFQNEQKRKSEPFVLNSFKDMVRYEEAYYCVSLAMDPDEDFETELKKQTETLDEIIDKRTVTEEEKLENLIRFINKIISKLEEDYFNYLTSNLWPLR